MIVKVCGLREPENIRAVEAAGADWTGFVFYPPSPRYAGDVQPGDSGGRHRIGVFVSADYDEIMRRRDAFGLRGAQLHGDASATLCRRLRGAGLTVIRALPADGFLCDRAGDYTDCADYFLFDTPTAAHGGSGRQYDWTLLEAYAGPVPFLLSGGLRPGSLPALRRFAHPMWAGIDLNSGFETRPGLKDTDKLKTFIENFRQP